MKFILSIILTALLSLVLQLFLPWWTIVIAAFIAGVVIPLGGFRAFLSGLLGVAIVWWVYSLMIDMQTNSILSEKIAVMFHAGSPLILILLCGLLAGVIGGFASLSGKALHGIIKGQ